MAKRIIVTGGAGFLGSHLCDRLIERGDLVFCVDSLITGRMSNIAHLMGSNAFKFIKHDIIAPFSIEGGIDEIYNLACPASPLKYELDPIHTFQTCILGSTNILEIARRTGARALQASTSEVYGDSSISPQSETYHGNVNTVGPRSCYDEGKRAAETLFHDFHERYGVEIKLPRIFNTYGPRMSPDDGRVVSNFITQALSGEDLTIYGTGDQTRSFCYVDDLVRGLIRLMESPAEIVEPVNLGNPGEFTMLELADLVVAKTGSTSGRRFLPALQDDPIKRRPDISLARSLLNWSPTIPLSEGLDHTIAYFREEQQQRHLAAEA